VRDWTDRGVGAALVAAGIALALAQLRRGA